MKIDWDVETFGVLDLTDVGAWKFAADPRSDVHCVAYSVDGGTPQLWLPGNSPPEEIVAAAQDPSSLFFAHNAGFEIAVHQLILRRRYVWPKIPLAQHRCT